MEKLKSHRITAMKITPNSPRWYFMAVWRRSIPSRPLVRLSGVSSMIMAEQLQITMVSMKTPRAWSRPSFAGWLISAAAAAQGAEPEPASLEKSPRLAPFMITAPIPPPAT